MGSYKLSVAAQKDVSEIFEYGIFKFGLNQAQRYLNEMESHFYTLSTNTDLGRDASELVKGLKRFSSGAHVVFYLSTDDGILIVRILHQSRDFERHL